MSSAAEAGVRGFYKNCHKALPLQNIREEPCYKQPAMGIDTDNSTAANILNDTCNQKHFKLIDMRFYWVQDCIEKDQFCLSWVPLHTKLDDYPSKHHLTIHHNEMRQFFVHTITSPDKTPIDKQGCLYSCIGSLCKINMKTYNIHSSLKTISGIMNNKRIMVRPLHHW